MLRHIAMKDAPPVMRNYKEAIQQAKVQHWHGEEVHRGYCFTMIAQKSRPSHCRLRAPRCLSHPAQHRALREIKAKHLQFTMYSRRTPSLVLGNHEEDQLAQFPADTFSSHTEPMSRNPGPIQLEACPMPAKDGFGLDENQSPVPMSPEPPQHHPEQFVRQSESRLRMLLLENGKLLPKSQIFQEQVAARAKKSSKEYSQEPQMAQHEISFTC
jgi:hypothetical protein